MSNVNTEESPYELALEVSATGNAATRLSANESTYSAVTESDARLGGAIELRYLGGDVDKVRLSYKIADEYILNENSEYAGKSLDLQGIKRYNIFRYFEEINMLLPVATEFDEESNILYAETDELGTYCVLDMEILMRNFGIEPESISTETVTKQMYSAATSSDDGEAASDKYSVTFIIDVRKDAFTSDQLNRIIDAIHKFSVNSYLEQRDVTIRIVAQDSTDFRTVKHITIGEYTTPNELVSGFLNVGILTATSEENFLGSVLIVTDALSDVVENCENSGKNFVFNIYNQQNAVFEQSIADELCKNAKKKGINISLISLSKNGLTGFQKCLTSDTKGIELTKSLDFEKEVYEHVYKEKYSPKESFPVIISTGFQYVVLDSKLYPNGGNPYGNDSDTDVDGVTDWDEVRSDLLKCDNEGNYTLPTIGDCINSLGDVPFYVENVFKVADYSEDLAKAYVFSHLWDTKILPIKSDPTNADGDEDGFNDNIDVSPLKAICFFNFDYYKKYYYGDKTTLTIFVDQPYFNSREVINPNDEEEYVGHTFVGIDSSDGYKEYAGFWPVPVYDTEKAILKLSVSGRIRMQGFAYNTSERGNELVDPYYVKGEVWYESEHKWDVANIWVIDDSQKGKLYDFSENYNRLYNMLYDNCTTFAIKALHSFDIWPKIYPHYWESSEYFGVVLTPLGYFGYSPADAGQDIRKHYPYHIYYGEETDGNRSQKGVIGGWNYNE